MVVLRSGSVMDSVQLGSDVMEGDLMDPEPGQY